MQCMDSFVARKRMTIESFIKSISICDIATSIADIQDFYIPLTNVPVELLGSLQSPYHCSYFLTYSNTNRSMVKQRAWFRDYCRSAVVSIQCCTETSWPTSFNLWKVYQLLLELNVGLSLTVDCRDPEFYTLVKSVPRRSTFKVINTGERFMGLRAMDLEEIASSRKSTHLEVTQNEPVVHSIFIGWRRHWKCILEPMFTGLP